MADFYLYKCLEANTEDMEGFNRLHGYVTVH